MRVDNLPFLARQGAQNGRLSTLILCGTARRRLDADDGGQRQVVGVGGDVVDALFVKGDADDLA